MSYQPVTPFHVDNRRIITAVRKFIHGTTQFRLEPTGGFVHSYVLRTPGAVRRVRVRDENGANIVDASPRALALLAPPNPGEIIIPIGLDDRGLAAAPDMNARCCYHVDIIGATEPGVLYTDYWPLRASLDMLGRPQAQVPPHPGLQACINEFPVTPDDRGNLPMRRVGNHIQYLALLHDEPQFRANVVWDIRVRSHHVASIPPVVVHDAGTDRREWWPTFMSTIIELSNINPPIFARGIRPRWVIRDVFGPEVDKRA